MTEGSERALLHTLLTRNGERHRSIAGVVFYRASGKSPLLSVSRNGGWHKSVIQGTGVGKGRVYSPSLLGGLKKNKFVPTANS